MMIQFEQVKQWPKLPFKFFQHQAPLPIAVPAHWHPGIELNFLVSGGPLIFTENGQAHQFTPGDCWAVDRRVIHRAVGAGQLNWDEFGFIIDETFLQGKLPVSASWHLQLQGRPQDPAQDQAYQALFTHALAIRKLLVAGLDDYDRLIILSHFYQMLVLLGRHFVTLAEEVELARNPQLVDRVMTKIHHDYATELHSADLAVFAHVSLTTLNQQFQELVGMSVHAYIRQVRLISARRLLLETNKSIDYIATQCGFGSIKTFQRNFLNWLGQTPSQFRKTATRQPDLRQAQIKADNDADCLR